MNRQTDAVGELLTKLDDRWRTLVETSSDEALVWRPPESTCPTITQLVGHFAETQSLMLLRALGRLEGDFHYHVPYSSISLSKQRLIAIINTTDAEKDESLYYLSSLDLDVLVDVQAKCRVSRQQLILHTIDHSAEHLGEASLLSQLWFQRDRMR